MRTIANKKVKNVSISLSKMTKGYCVTRSSRTGRTMTKFKSLAAAKKKYKSIGKRKKVSKGLLGLGFLGL